jgi:DinB superfamily
MSHPTGTIMPPDASEYAPYYGQYIALVPGGDVVVALENQITATTQLLARVTDAQADFRYLPDKWSVKEVVGHILDAERIMGYRALRIARSDITPLPGFEQDDYVKSGGFGARRLSGLLEEFSVVRCATVLLFRSFEPAAWTRQGTANEKSITVRALAYVIAGHELHHRRILAEKYLRPAAV